MADGQWAWHVHHQTLVEQLRDPDGLAERQGYIKGEKPRSEQARRLRLLKVVKNQELLGILKAGLEAAFNLPAVPRDMRLKVRAGIRRALNVLHAHECKKCPWNGRTIFPREK